MIVEQKQSWLSNTSRPRSLRHGIAPLIRVALVTQGLASASSWPPSPHPLPFFAQHLNSITMVTRSSVTRGLRLATLQGRIAANGVQPWINHYRLAAAATGFPSINRKKSTGAKQLDMANLMVPEIQDPLERFRYHFTKGTLTRPLVISCLEDAVSLNKPGSRMGEAAIMWIWRSYDSIEYPGDADLLNLIALLLVREAKEELMWDWMDQESQKLHVRVKSTNDSVDLRHGWRTAAFRGLVEAKAHLATDHSLDAALEAFLRGTKVPFCLSTRPSANFCHRMLVGTTKRLDPRRSYEDMRNGLLFTNTSPRLWDAFYAEIDKRQGRSNEADQATMRLFHPQRPDPWPYLKFLRRVEKDQNHPLRHIKVRSGAIALIEIARDLRLVLKHQGHYKEAAWVRKFALELYPQNKHPTGLSERERLIVVHRPLPSFSVI